jgi:hypothetical protein
MTLEEKMYFDCTLNSTEDAKRKAEVAEEFAIEFAEWLIDGHVSKLTLEEFKKQKETNMCQYCGLENGNHKLSCPVIKVTMLL